MTLSDVAERKRTKIISTTARMGTISGIKGLDRQHILSHHHQQQISLSTVL